MTPTKVCVLGCGPAGLLAAWAALISGFEPHIFSKKVKSTMPGTQYLHQPIPELSQPEPDGNVTYIKRGTMPGYANKVYGSPDAPCSWAKFQVGDHEVWRLDRMYDDLWETFETSITDRELRPNDINMFAAEFPLVISSIPKPRICTNMDHEFRSQTIWITQEPPKLDPIHQILGLKKKNVIIYDGTDNVHWYRASQLFGKYAIETTRPMADQGWSYGHKPIRTDCDCHHDLDNFFCVGRFGLWKKGVLSHNAFWDTIQILEKTVGRRVPSVV